MPSEGAGEQKNPQIDPREQLIRKHFARPFKDTRRWINIVHQPSNLDVNLFGQLYSDCFTHHNEVRYAPADQDTFHFQNDPKRLVRKNNLTTYFQTRFLERKLPEYKSAPIYQSPNSVEDEAELGESCGFDYFYRCVTAIPFDPNDRFSPTMGENRITFLIGNVGVGKTFKISRVAKKIADEGVDEHGYMVIPVYSCLETFVSSHGNTNDSPELVRRFLSHLLDLIKRSTLQRLPQLASEIQIESPPRDATSEQVAMKISELLKFFARSASTSIRIVVFLDNLDVLHYQNSRYIFFPSEYTKQRKFIEEKITKIIFSFVDPNLLGDCGLCVCVTARQNVARESRLLNQPALPRRIELNDHSVFQLGTIDALDVVRSRLTMFEQVLKDYSSKRDNTSGQLHYTDQLSLLKVKTGLSVAPGNLTDGLRRVSDLSHHGARSLVDFLSKLRLNLLQQSDAVDRLFGHSPWLLERLYIANLHQRFSQAQGHFPNLFLVDGAVNEQQISDVHHRQNYWLKYLLLRRVGLGASSGISVQEILDEFVEQFGYEQKLVRLALGSLAMVNESRCIEIHGVAQDECHENLVRLTTRGQLLIGAHPKYRFPYCFELSYIQMVIDDHLLSLPKPFSARIAVETSLNYAFESNDNYYHRMRHDLLAKLPAALTFTRVLEAAWNSECLFRPKLAASAATLGPNFEKIYEHLIDTVKRVAVQASFNPNQIIDQVTKLKDNNEFDLFFQQYAEDYDKLELENNHDSR